MLLLSNPVNRQIKLKLLDTINMKNDQFFLCKIIFGKYFELAVPVFATKWYQVFFSVLISTVSDELWALTRFHTQSNEECTSPCRLQEEQLSLLLCDTAIIDCLITFQPEVTQQKLNTILIFYYYKLSSLIPCVPFKAGALYREKKILVRKNIRPINKLGMFSWDTSGYTESRKRTALRREGALFTSCSLGARSLHEHAPLSLRPHYVSFLCGLTEALI